MRTTAVAARHNRNESRGIIKGIYRQLWRFVFVELIVFVELDRVSGVSIPISAF